MKRILNFLALSLFLQVNVSATIYYVSNSGKDDHTGLSAEWPLQTLNRAAELALPGDAILLKRGDIFRESVTFGTIHIRIGAYGPADEPLPVISGAIPVEGFMPFRDGIYRARVSITPGYLFVDGKLMTIARYPNEGWLRTKYWEDTRIPRDATSEQLAKPNTMVECAELQNYSMNKDDFWIGAKIRWRHHSWWYETRDVVDYESSGKLYLSDRSFGVQNPRPGMSKGWGFYLDNKLELLDSPGEWYFDREQGFVYLFPPEGMQLGKVLVETSVRDTGISITDGMIQHISFRHQKDIGLRIKGSCVVQYCEFEGIGRDAAVSEGLAGGAAIRAETETRDTRISHNLFRNNLNNAIAWWQDRRDSTSSVIERNIVENSGTVPGYGGSGSWHGVAILIGTGRNVQVQYNRVEKSGYAGILFGTEGNAAEYNVIHHAMSTMNDGGGIYTNCSHSIIRYNIITDTRGGMESSGSWATIAHGIWPEFLGEYRNNVIEFNTVSGSGGDGIFLPNNFESIVRKNVCYNNDRFQLLIIGRGDQVLNVHQEHLVSENILYAASHEQNAFYFDERNDYGILKDNYFCKPSSDTLIHEGKSWPGMGPHQHFTVKGWQAEYDWADTSPRTDLRKLKPGEADRSRIFINDSEQRKTIPLNGNWLDLNGEPAGKSITLEPYTSQILLEK